jgi:hypothetical protein
MSNICTHLACRVRWIEEGEQFFCSHKCPWFRPGGLPCDMNDLRRDRWLAAVLFAPLALSFVLCIASDLGFSATLNQAGTVLPATGRFIGLGISWLVGHGLHGAAVFAVPIFILARGRAASGQSDGGAG